MLIDTDGINPDLDGLPDMLVVPFVSVDTGRIESEQTVDYLVSIVVQCVVETVRAIIIAYLSIRTCFKKEFDLNSCQNPSRGCRKFLPPEDVH